PAPEVSQRAIRHHFGGKEGRDHAPAGNLATTIASDASGRGQPGQARLAEIQAEGRPARRDEARELLTSLLHTLAEVMVSERSRPWARFLIREQMEPTEAFSRVYERVMRPMLEAIRHLVGILLDEAPTAERVRLRALSLIGSVIVFRVANA